MANKLVTMTAPRAIIKSRGKAIGEMRNLRVTETIQRGSVRGLGTMFESERPPLSFNGSWNCDMYMIDLQKSGIPGLDNRNVPNTKVWEQTKLLFAEPVDIYVFKKEASVTDESGNVVSISEGDFAVIRDVYLDTMSFDISEGAISSYNQSGVYTQPIILPSI